MVKRCKACGGYGYYRERAKNPAKRWRCLSCGIVQVVPVDSPSLRKHNVKKRNPAVMEDIPTKEILLERIANLKKEWVNGKESTLIRNKALIAFLFCTGCRITEVVGTKDKILKDEVGEPVKNNTIKKKQVEILTEPGQEGLAVVRNVWTLKRRKKPLRRDIYINIDNDPILWKYFWDYAESKSSEACLFPITRSRAAQIVKGAGLFCHLLRHMKLTELNIINNFQHEDLKIFTGWRSSSSAESYIHPRKEDIIRKIRGENKIQ